MTSPGEKIHKGQSTAVRAAIIGMGSWGQNLVNHVQGKSDGLIRFTTGATRTPAKAAEFSQKHGIRMRDSYEAVLADPEVDAVVLATPHSLHAEQIMAAARAGKHVYTEKPLGLDSTESAAAVQACADHGVTLAVGYNWRFQPALQEIRRMLDDGRLGKLLHMEGNFCGPSAYRWPRGHWRQDRDETPAGGMTGRGVHVADAMLYLAQSRIDSVFAQSFRLAQDFGADDTTSMLFRFASGATAYLGTVIASAETWRLQVFGARGWAEVGAVEHLNTWQLRVSFIDPANVLNKKPPEVLTFPDTSTERAELEHFARAVMAGQALDRPDGDALHNVLALEAILKSTETGQPVAVQG
ncbi:MAG: Gfo/Idh/MocA family oxidoreductase [Pseudomonadota bacterium]